MQIARTRSRIPHLLREHSPYMIPYTIFLSVRLPYELQDTISLSRAPPLGTRRTHREYAQTAQT